MSPAPFHPLLKVNRIAQQCRNAGELFVDSKFPPNLQSIFRNGKDSPSGALALPHVADIQWLRPDQMSPISLAGRTIDDTSSCDSMEQGVAHTGYLLMALAWCASRQDLVDEIVIDEGASVGVFGCKFHLQGRWHTVVIDSLFPCVNGTPIFTSFCRGGEQDRGTSKELYAMIVEKAWAKLHGSYEAINGGFAEDACAYLSGSSSSHINFREGNGKEEIERGDLWSRLSLLHQQQVKDRSALLTAAGVEAPASRPGDSYLICGLVQSEGLRLVRLRNPWGRVKWLGDWSDASPKWQQHPKVAQAVNFAPSSDASFWIGWDDFLRVFSSVGASLVEPPWPKQTFPGQWQGPTCGGLGENFFRNPGYCLRNGHHIVRITLEQVGTPSLKVMGDTVERRRSAGQFDEIYLLLFKMPPPGETPKLQNALRKRMFKNRLESMEVSLDPAQGPYLIVPSLTTEKLEGVFWLTILSPQPCDVSKATF